MVNTVSSQALLSTPTTPSSASEDGAQTGVFQGQDFGQWLQAKLTPLQPVSTPDIGQTPDIGLPLLQGGIPITDPVMQPVTSPNTNETVTTALGVGGNILPQATTPLMVLASMTEPEAKTENNTTPLEEDLSSETSTRDTLFFEAIQTIPDNTVQQLHGYFATALPVSPNSPGILPPTVTLNPQMLPATTQGSNASFGSSPSPISKLELTADQRQALNASWITNIQVVVTPTQETPQATPGLQQLASTTLPMEVNTPNPTPLLQAPQATAQPPLWDLSTTPVQDPTTQTILTGLSDKQTIVAESGFKDPTPNEQQLSSLTTSPQPLSSAKQNTSTGGGQAHAGAGSSSEQGQTPQNTLDNIANDRFAPENSALTPDAAALGITPATVGNSVPVPPVASQISDAIAGVQSAGGVNSTTAETSTQGGQKTLTLDLKPEALGSVKIQMISQGDTLVSTRVIVSTPEAQQALQDSFNDIKVQLAKQGVTLKSLDVVFQPASVGSGLSAVEAMMQSETAGSGSQQNPRDAQQEAWNNTGSNSPFSQSSSQNAASGFSQGNAGQGAQQFQQLAQEQARRQGLTGVNAAGAPAQNAPNPSPAAVESQPTNAGRVSVLV